MKIAVLGTGTVGKTIGTKLIETGNQVMMGSRTEKNVEAFAWKEKNGSAASIGTFAQAAAFGDIVINCTKGSATLDALAAAGAENLNGKLLIDISNPIGMPDESGFPVLTVCNTDSLAEQIQRTYPAAKVVKTLNTMWCGIMVNPRMLAEDHQVYVSGNDLEAKQTTIDILKSFGWKENEVLDLGNISTARGPEMALIVWLRIYGATKSGAFNFKIVH